MPAGARYLLPGAVAGIAVFAFSRVMIEPLVGRAVDYESAREHAEARLLGDGHDHGPELFTRAVQENVGSAVGIVAFCIAMSVLFAVVHTVMRTVLARRGLTPDPTALALSIGASMFVAIVLIPGLKYPANPPGIGLPDTMEARSSAFVAITIVSVVSAAVAVAAALAGSPRWGSRRAAAAAIIGYVAVMLGAMVLLPSFHEVPAPLTGPDGLAFDGFPAEVQAEFQLYSLLNQALMWLVIAATFGCLAALRRTGADRGLGAGQESWRRAVQSSVGG
jgi:hypothetical protein